MSERLFFKERAMIITFCGHSMITDKPDLPDRVLAAITEIAAGKDVTFYIGACGTFDGIARACCRKYKERHPSARVIFVTPYLDEKYLKARDHLVREFDETIYPPIEKTPRRFAIIKRNEWMVKQADYVIAFVRFGWGGAARMLRYAMAHHVPFLNLSGEVLD